jgi:hypothetical protein
MALSGLLGVGLVGSQAGHLVAFQLRFGSAAQHLQSSGAHAYFPLLAKTTLGAIAAAFLAGIFVIGLARVLSGRSRMASGSAPKYIELVAALFTIQLACFITQEVGEAMVAGIPVDSAHLLLWGTLGQLPVAAIGAIALGWLWTRFESAVDDLCGVLAVAQPPQAPLAAAVALWLVPDRALLLSQIAGGSLAKRGPPPSLRLSS